MKESPAPTVSTTCALHPRLLELVIGGEQNGPFGSLGHHQHLQGVFFENRTQRILRVLRDRNSASPTDPLQFVVTELENRTQRKGMSNEIVIEERRAQIHVKHPHDTFFLGQIQSFADARPGGFPALTEGSEAHGIGGLLTLSSMASFHSQ